MTDSMLANPGGLLAPNEVVGREKMIQRLWHVLNRQSLVLTAERRIGKTSIIKKMRAESPEAWTPFFRDLEGLRTPLAFVQDLYAETRQFLGKKQRAAKGFNALLKEFGGIEIAGVIKLPERSDTHWQALMMAIFTELSAREDKRFVFFWDEMPLMLENFKASHGEQLAMAFLDSLRAVRQNHGRIRMVFTGSIGLHHVISQLKKSGYANAPINDMFTMEVPPLAERDAADLAQKLLKGEGIETSDVAALADVIAAEVGYIPYYIHHVVDQLGSRGEPVAPEALSGIVEACLLDSQDPWDMAHYRERIDTYYRLESEDHTRLVVQILDEVASAEGALDFEQLIAKLGHCQLEPEPEALRSLLMLMQRDHYLVQSKSGFSFRHLLVSRWWALSRGLR